jgi:uncharacterized protein (DUF2147 family)
MLRSGVMPLPRLETLERRLRGVALALALGAPATALAAPSPVGYWTTIDDDGKTPSSIVQIYARGKKLYGKIVQLINPREKDPKCTECEGARKNQRILGMEVLRDLEQDDDEWSGGYILDPRNGTEYKCYLELQDGGKRLKVRGYVGIALLGRTQYWQKAAPPPPSQPAAAPPPAAPPPAAPPPAH